MNRPRYQLGTLYSEPRKSGPDVWVYRWRETDEQGRRTLRKQIVGTVRELRTQADAQRVAETLRLNINRYTIDHGGSVVTVHKLVEHYRMKEMPMDTHEGKTRATKLVYQNCLKLYIVPRWGDYPLRRVTSVEVEDWLKTLKLAGSTRAKIRNLMSTIFRHAIRWGFLGQQENPIALVRVKAGRKRVPDTLTGKEFRALMAVLPDRERVIGGICATTGLRVCEVLGLKWEDVDFVKKTANVHLQMSSIATDCGRFSDHPRSFSISRRHSQLPQVCEQKVPLRDIDLLASTDIYRDPSKPCWTELIHKRRTVDLPALFFPTRHTMLSSWTIRPCGPIHPNNCVDLGPIEGTLTRL